MVNLLLVLMGSGLMALAVNMFLIPLHLAEGGVVGVGIILFHLSKLPIWVTVLGLNIPILGLGVKERGWGLLWRSLLGTGAFSAWLAVTANMEPLTQAPLLGIVYGGVLMGIGLGMVLRAGATTGGTDILALVLHQRLGLSVGQWILAIDAVVITCAGVAFHSAETAMYSAITLVISSKVVDLVQEGLYAAKAMNIITSDPEGVASEIMSEVGRGVTLLSGTGAYTGQQRSVVYCVMQRGEMATVKRIVYRRDPRAFVVVHDAHEVLGEGFKEGPMK